MRRFTFLQAEMVGVELLARLADIDDALGPDRPRQLDEPVEIVAHHRIFGRALGQALEARQLALRLGLDLLGHLRVGDALLQLGDLLAAPFAFALAQLLLDGLQLLAQQIFALAAVDLLLGLIADLARQAQHLEPVIHQLGDAAQAGADIADLEHLLLFLDADIHDRGDQVGELPRGRHLADGVDQLRPAPAAAAASTASSAWRRRLAAARASSSGVRASSSLDRLDLRHEERIAVEEPDHAEPVLPLADER